MEEEEEEDDYLELIEQVYGDVKELPSKRRRVYRHPSISKPEWSNTLKDHNVSDPTSYSGKKFRRRFRYTSSADCLITLY